ncbi:MAG: formate dehydrogenase subunit alpha [Methanobacteriota archaeon]|nr:MAG: formate dehydrogenase subunit alpha [Euryarchaeota archaeon]
MNPGCNIDYNTVLTTCPYCGCGCGLQLHVLDGRVVGVTPPKEHPISRGSLCIKGWNAHVFIHSKDRLTKPLIRKGDKFVATSWGKALNLVVDNLKKIRDENGPDAVGVLASARCTNEENYLLSKFARVVLGTNNIDHCARLCHASTVVALGEVFGSGAMTNSPTEFEKSDCILVTGSNTLEQHPLIGATILKARDKGAKIIVVDPRKIMLARFADIYLQPKPGTDVAWINGFMNIILSENLHDKEFIEKRTEGFEELRETIKKYTPERVEKITGIPKNKLVEAAKMFGVAERAAIVYSMGITQHVTGVDNVRSIANLAMLTGNVGREGTGVNPLRGQNNVQGACDMGALPNVYTGYQKITDEKIVEKFEEAWQTKLPRNAGLTVVEMTEAAVEGRLKALYVVGENPMLSDPDINRVRKGLEKLDFLVVQDIFMSETAELADVVLPGASYAEKDGTFTATDRCVQRVRKAIEPIGDAKADWEIICAIAKGMGSHGFEYSSPKEVFEEIARLTPSYAGITYERLDKELRIPWPCPTRDHPGTPILHVERFTRGKGRFTPAEYREPAELPDDEYPFLLTTGRTLFHYHTGTMTRRTPKLVSEVETGYVELNGEDAKILGVKNNDLVVVTSRRGSIQVPVWVTDRVPRGVVFIPFHFAECAANVLTHAKLDPEAKIPEYKVCAVKIEKKNG